ASGELTAAEGPHCRPRDRVRSRRDHPHREQLQVHDRVVRPAGAEYGLDAARLLDRRQFPGAGARHEGVALAFAIRAGGRGSVLPASLICWTISPAPELGLGATTIQWEDNHVA